MGDEKLDNSVYLIRGLFDLADMARSKGDGATYGVGERIWPATCSGASRTPGGCRRGSPSTRTRSTIRRAAGRTTGSRTSTGSA